MRSIVSTIIQNLDKILASLLIIISSVLIIRSILISSILSLLNGLFLLIPCLAWLVLRKRESFKFHLPESKSLVTPWAICFFILYSLTIISVYFRPNLYERPLLYFILTALLGGVIACEILTAERKHTGFILIQIMILGMSITWTQQMITPGLVGIDPWFHMFFTNQIIDGGFIPSGYSYSGLPFFHLMIAATSIITSLPYKFAALVSVSFAQIACNAFFLFLIANYLLKNYRIGLFAALLLITASEQIFMSYWSIPNAFAAIFIPLILYLILIKIDDTPKLIIFILFIITSISIILTHSLVAISMVIILFVVWGAFTFYHFFYLQTKNHISLIIPVFFIMGVAAWWIYMTNYMNILVTFINENFSFTGVHMNNFVIPPIRDVIFSILGPRLFLCLSIIGILYMLSRKESGSIFCIASVSVTLLGITFIGYLININIYLDRLSYITQIILSISVAIALYLIGTWKTKKLVYIYIFFLGFIVALSFLMIMGPEGNSDNFALTPNSGLISHYYTQSELSGSDFFAKYSPGVISSDFIYAYCDSSSIFRYVYDINPERLNNIDPEVLSGDFVHDGSIKILRSRQITNYQKTGTFSSNIRPDIYSYLSNSGFDKIYNNFAITGYIG